MGYELQERVSASAAKVVTYDVRTLDVTSSLDKRKFLKSLLVVLVIRGGHTTMIP
jgi:hypothetical protein